MAALPASLPCTPAGAVLRRALRQLLACCLLAVGVAGCASPVPAPVPRPASTAFDQPHATPLGQLVQARREQARARSPSAFFLLDSEEAAFTSRLALVEAARRSLDLQYYAIHADASTEVLLQRIRAAAGRGVRVRILLDDFNSVGPDAQVLRLAFERGIEVRLFNPVSRSRGSLAGRILGSLHDVERLQKRMHNKLFLADSAWGITGGRNLGDAYFGGDGDSHFVDLDVLAAGAIVRTMAASFDRYWNDPLAYPVQDLLAREDLERLHEQDPGQQRSATPQAAASAPATPGPLPASKASATAAPGAVLPHVSAAAADAARRPPMDLQRTPLVWAPAELLVDKPGKIQPGDEEVDAGETVVDGLLDLMRGARREVVVISPYFVPGAQMMQAFAELRRRGVAVRVLTNSLASNDAPAAHAGYRRYRPELLALGVELYEMRAAVPAASSATGSSGGRAGGGSGIGGSKAASSRASLHSKAVIIDRTLSVIGSMNLDLRSQLKNSEVALVIRSRKLAEQAARLVEDTMGADAWRLQQQADGRLRWRAPAGASFGDADSEPDAGWKLRLLVNVLAPFAPDEML